MTRKTLRRLEHEIQRPQSWGHRRRNYSKAYRKARARIRVRLSGRGCLLWSLPALLRRLAEPEPTNRKVYDRTRISPLRIRVHPREFVRRRLLWNWRRVRLS